MAGLAVLLGVGLFVAYAAAVLLVMLRLRRPPRRTYATAVARGIPGDPRELDQPRRFRAFDLGDVAPEARPREIPCWDIEGDDPGGPIVILTPGWGDSRIGALARVSAIAPAASRIFAWDPPGQGDAPGLCALGTREHRLLGMLARYAAELHDRDVVLQGWSLGAGTSIVTAAGCAKDADARIIGVIAEAPYREAWTPAFRVLDLSGLPWRANGPVAFALLGLRLGVGPRWRGFDRAAHAQRVRVPAVVVHGSEDEVCPIEDGRAIAEAAPRGSLVVIEGGHHNDLWVDPVLAGRMAKVVSGAVADLGRATVPAPGPGVT